MAWTTGEVALPELVETSDEIDQKAQQLANLIRNSKHFIVFTGAGVSTSAGIPDFRGPDGAWTLQAQGRQRTTAAVSTLQAIPTATHMALVALQNQGLMKYLVSQNCDGLHRRSGILPVSATTTHTRGRPILNPDLNRVPRTKSLNSTATTTARSAKTAAKNTFAVSPLPRLPTLPNTPNPPSNPKTHTLSQTPDFRAVADHTKSILDHRTGRKCAVCDGVLHDTIINFTESLPERDFKLASDHAKKADLCLVLGSSLTVTPANEIPEAVGNRRRRGAKLVICNLQATPLDGMAELRVHAKTDELMVRVMRELGVGIPEFVLRRRLSVLAEAAGEGRGRRCKVTVAGVDVDGTPVSFLRSVRLVNHRRVLKAEPFAFDLRGDSAEEGYEVRMELDFMGHYGEPNLELVHVVEETPAVYLLEYNPENGEWKTDRE